MGKSPEEKEVGLINAIKNMSAKALDKISLEGASAAVFAAVQARRAELDAKAAKGDEALLVMEKTGEKDIRVHPTQVGPWQAQGWTVKE